MKECFGWRPDARALMMHCDECEYREECLKDWRASGGRMGGYYDKNKM